MKSTRKMAALVLVVVLLLGTLVTGVSPSGQAKKKTKTKAITVSYTIFVGEKVTVFVDCGFDKIKSLKSSNTKVVRAAIKPEDSSIKFIEYVGEQFSARALKTGKSTVTVKTKGKKTYKYKLTVKQLNLECTPLRTADGKNLIKIKNNSGAFVPQAQINYSVLNESGNVIGKDSISVKDLASGSTVFSGINLDGATVTIDSVKPTAGDAVKNRKNASKEVKVGAEAKDGWIQVSTKEWKLKSAEDIRGYVTVVLFDASGNILQYRKYEYDYEFSLFVNPDLWKVPNDYSYCKVYHNIVFD